MKAGDKVGAIDLHLKNVSDIAVVRQNKMAAYFPKTDDVNANKTTSSMKIKILPSNVGNAKICRIPNVQARIRVTIQVKDKSSEKTFNVRNNCNNKTEFFGKEISFPVDGTLYDNDDSGMYKAIVTVAFIDGAMTNAQLGGSDNYSINYNLQLTGARSNDGVLALRENDSPQLFGLRSSYVDNPDAAGGRQVQAGVIFGYPCNTDVAHLIRASRKVKLYDADGVFGATYMWVEKNNEPLNKNQYEDGGFHVTNENAPLVRVRSWDGNNKRWALDDSNGEFNAVTIKTSAIDVKAKYTLMILNTGKDYDGSNSTFVPHGNTLSVSIPFDSINGANKCDYDLRPSINPPANSSNTVPVGATIAKTSVVGNITVQGVDDDSHAWRLTARAYKDRRPNVGAVADSTLAPCSWRTGTTGPACATKASGTVPNGFDGTFSSEMNSGYNTSGLEAGDWVCFMMSVQKPTYNSSATKWRHSALKCIGIGGASPGVSVTPDTYSYFPKLEVIADIRNEGGYPKVDTFKSRDYKRNGYDWKLIEAKFSSKPSNIGTSDNGGCNTVREVGGFLNGSCKVINSGSNLFPNSGDPSPKTGSSNGDGPDPIGTWTCYTFSYLTNPKPLSGLRSDINAFVSDWNDNNSTSTNPGRWGDGHYRYWVPAVRDEDGKVITPGYWQYVGDTLNANQIWRSYVEASPDSTNPKYKFTPYRLASCSQSGIDPKVQIRGNDLKVDGSITTFVRTMEVGNAIGSYGSGGEYGVLSGSQNSGFASGSGMLRGLSSPDQGNWSTLTFTNNNPAVGYGNFHSVPPQNVQTPDGSIPYDGRTTFNSGEKIIYQKVVGTLVINSNLTYANTYSRVGQIPRVIISADNIEIGPNVTRIDPWLIATSSISTCGPPRGAQWGDSASMALGNADLRTGECNRPLIFNGPVYTANLYLYRTGGSRIPKADLRDSWANPDSGINPDDYCEESDCGNGSNGRKYALSAPAEVFNLRPDIFLSSFAGASTGNPVATTDKVTELPPRF